MIIRCPSCSTTYKVDGSVFDAPKPTFRCSRCKHIFAVQVRLQLQADDPSSAAAAANRTPEADATARRPVADPQPDAGVRADTAEEPSAQGSAGTDDGDTFPLFGETEAAEDAAAAGGDEDPDFEPLVETRQTESFERTAAIDDDDAVIEDNDEVIEDNDEVIEDNDAPVRNVRQPDFEIDDDFLIPPKREAPPPPPMRGNAKGSIVPSVSLVALAVLAFLLVTLIYQVNPQPLDSVLRRIPWYGSTVFENRHFKRTLGFESLVTGVQPVLNQKEVFTVSGKLVNGNDRSVHKVRIETQLFDAEGKQVGRQVTFVGNAISAKIIRDMTFREISLLQSLKPQSAYRIPAKESANFTVVFPKPDATVESFSCRVLSADAAA